MAEIRDLTNAAYHNGEGLSSSDLKLLLRSPYHYKHKVFDRKETPSMKLGTATHCALFEPERFLEDYIETPYKDKRTKEGREIWQDIEQSGKIVLSRDEMRSVKGMVDAVKTHKYASKLAEGGIAEQSVFWDENGVLCKCRPDYLKDMRDGYVIIDLKTTKDARERPFRNISFYDFHYHISAAHYMRGMKALRGEPAKAFIFIAVENVPPYGVNVYQAGAEFLKAGNDECERLYGIYRCCDMANDWPCYSDEIKVIEPPYISKEDIF